jgi:hypothetical protein
MYTSSKKNSKGYNKDGNWISKLVVQVNCVLSTLKQGGNHLFNCWRCMLRQLDRPFKYLLHVTVLVKVATLLGNKNTLFIHIIMYTLLYILSVLDSINCMCHFLNTLKLWSDIMNYGSYYILHYSHSQIVQAQR